MARDLVLLTEGGRSPDHWGAQNKKTNDGDEQLLSPHSDGGARRPARVEEGSVRGEDWRRPKDE